MNECPYCGQPSGHLNEVGGLTQRQGELLGWLKNRDWSQNISPSYDEICVGIKYSSKAGIHRMICALAERGYITFTKNRARSIKLIKKGQNDGKAAEESAEKADMEVHLPSEGKER